MCTEANFKLIVSISNHTERLMLPTSEVGTTVCVRVLIAYRSMLKGQFCVHLINELNQLDDPALRYSKPDICYPIDYAYTRP